MEIDDWLIVNSETNEIEMGIRWDGKTKWPVPEGMYGALAPNPAKGPGVWGVDRVLRSLWTLAVAG